MPDVQFCRPGGCKATEPRLPETAPDVHSHACVGQHHSGREHLCACGAWFVVAGGAA